MSLVQSSKWGSRAFWGTGRPVGRRPSTFLRRVFEFDLVLIVAAVMMAALGAIMVYSATRSGLITNHLDPHYWLKRDVVFLGVGAAIMAVLSFVDYHVFERYWVVIYGAAIFTLFVVLLPHVGTHILGSQRWLQLGSFQFQPSAFTGLAVIVSVAALMQRAEIPVQWRVIGKVLAVVVVAMGIVAKQPDLGSAIVIGIIAATMLVVGGAQLRQLVVLGIATALGVWLILHLGLLHGYQVSRLTSFLHPHQGTNSTNYNLNQSKIDIGSGGFFGKGLFHDQQTNLQYVPEQQTDFIFTAVGGQLGFVGACGVIVLYGVIAVRILSAARRAIDTFGTLLAAGAFSLLTFSVFENAGMTIGITPITGIPLPFMSYGGSADIAFFAALGITLSVSRTGRRSKSAPIPASSRMSPVGSGGWFR